MPRLIYHSSNRKRRADIPLTLKFRKYLFLSTPDSVLQITTRYYRFGALPLEYFQCPVTRVVAIDLSQFTKI